MDKLEKKINKLESQESVNQDNMDVELSTFRDEYKEYEEVHKKIVNEYMKSEDKHKMLEINIAIYLYKNKKTFNPYLNFE